MRKTGMTLIEIVVSMLVLAVAALAVAATISLVNSRQMRSAGGGSLDLQALSFARETLESLKNAVSTEEEHNGGLSDTSYGAICETSVGNPCDSTGVGTLYNVALPDTSDLFTRGGGVRSYRVWDISGGSNTVAYKRVTVTVTWND